MNHETFETPMELHCSQTGAETIIPLGRFETPMELHCSQTKQNHTAYIYCLRPLWNYTALKPRETLQPRAYGLRPLWNYTALKQNGHRKLPIEVWDPYGITLLSNTLTSKYQDSYVWDPYGITLLSNVPVPTSYLPKFETPMELHCSQTTSKCSKCYQRFETPMELHCSQTALLLLLFPECLRPLWNYTALKLHARGWRQSVCLRPLWNYTALKHIAFFWASRCSLRPLWNYTALKHIG